MNLHSDYNKAETVLAQVCTDDQLQTESNEKAERSTSVNHSPTVSPTIIQSTVKILGRKTQNPSIT